MVRSSKQDRGAPPTRRWRIWTAAAACAICGVLVSGQVSDPRVSSVPSELRDEAASILNEKSDSVRANRARALARKGDPATFEFLTALMERDRSPLVRRSLADRLGRVKEPNVQEALKRMAARDSDAAISLLALQRLYEAQNSDLRSLLEARLQKAKSAGDEPGYHALAKEDDRWSALERGNMLPAFLQSPSPVFEAKAPGGRLRVIAFGDFGNGSEEQQEVARAMARLQKRNPVDFGITLGDNFYSRGVQSLSDPYWQDRWEKLYTPLAIPFYATLGNHDWGHPDSPAAEILYSQRSKSWRMPASYYTFTAGPVQFFALDTTALGAAQLLWLREELGKSRARWKVVYGHHPIYSAGRYQDSARMKENLLPILRDRASFYFAGHDHDMQALKPDAGVRFFVVGGGGASLRDIQSAPHSLFAQSFHGFAVFEADERYWEVTFYDTSLEVMYRAGNATQSARN